MLMKIHEYQAKKILRQYQVAVPSGNVATTANQAEHTWLPNWEERS